MKLNLTNRVVTWQENGGSQVGRVIDCEIGDMLLVLDSHSRDVYLVDYDEVTDYTGAKGTEYAK